MVYCLATACVYRAFGLIWPVNYRSIVVHYGQLSNKNKEIAICVLLPGLCREKRRKPAMWLDRIGAGRQGGGRTEVEGPAVGL